MTTWQWKVIMALIRYVLSRDNDWVKYHETDINILFDALDREEPK